MIQYRSFRNSDPPQIAAIWNSQPPIRGRIPEVTPNFMAAHVFGKTYFDRNGLIVATLDDQPIGFAHAGFGPSSNRDCLRHEDGVISSVMTLEHPVADDAARGLIDQCETYLRAHGATHVTAFGYQELCPFYLGLYGGTQLPGVLTEQEAIIAAFHQAGYQQQDHTLILQRTLERGAIPIDRSQHLLKRKYDIEAAINPSDANWWDASTLGNFSRMQFDLLARGDDIICGQLLVWDMQPLAKSWNVTSAGLVDMNITPSHLSIETARFFIAEVSRYLYRRAISLLEVQHSARDERAGKIFTELGFEQVDDALLLQKKLS